MSRLPHPEEAKSWLLGVGAAAPAPCLIMCRRTSSVHAIHESMTQAGLRIRIRDLLSPQRLEVTVCEMVFYSNLRLHHANLVILIMLSWFLVHACLVGILTPKHTQTGARGRSHPAPTT